LLKTFKLGAGILLTQKETFAKTQPGTKKGTNRMTVHSEDQISDLRFAWWNPDFLDLIAERFALRQLRTVLDIGVGLGHWSRPILRHVCSDWTFYGLDIEEHWIQLAKQAFAAAFPAVDQSRMLFNQGDAHLLPYADETFDFVTSQTLLMHLRDPVKAIREMWRVLRVGGLVLCAEPINLINRLQFSTITQEGDVETLVDAYRLWMYFHRGIRVLNSGDHDIGSYLPGLFQIAGFQSIQAYTNDRAFVTLPSDCNSSDALSNWEDPQTIRQRARAGGAGESEIAAGLAAIEALQRLKEKQVSARRFSQGGLSAVIIVGARKGKG